jgi:hypothetical protein
MDNAKLKQQELDIKIKREEQVAAEQDLRQLLALFSDFFATSQEKDATYANIQANPSATYEKPFMKKIALAFLNVKRCDEALDAA